MIERKRRKASRNKAGCEQAPAGERWEDSYGQPHRLDGPAVIRTPGTLWATLPDEWWIHGIQYPTEMHFQVAKANLRYKRKP
jgi:hypothetical protein